MTQESSLHIPVGLIFLIIISLLCSGTKAVRAVLNYSSSLSAHMVWLDAPAPFKLSTSMWPALANKMWIQVFFFATCRRKFWKPVYYSPYSLLPLISGNTSQEGHVTTVGPWVTTVNIGPAKLYSLWIRMRRKLILIQDVEIRGMLVNSD